MKTRDQSSRQTHCREIIPRKFATRFDQEMPRYWCGDSAFMTHMLNTYTLLVPDNELYYIRHLSKCADEINDRALVSQLHAFCRQEAQHGMGHKAYWRNMEALGIRFKGFVKAVGWFNYKLLEPIMPRAIHLANIACIEHINAYLGRFFLQKNLLENAHPQMKLLFYWHFAEEIEHKSVAFDVYQNLYGSYALRVVGALLVFPLFYLINTTGTLLLLWQDKRLLRKDTWKDYWKFLVKDGALLYSLRNILAYLHPGFHPSHEQDEPLVKSFFLDSENSRQLQEFPGPEPAAAAPGQ